MIRMTYTINGKEIDLGTNDDGSGLFKWSELQANWIQLAGTLKSVCNSTRMNDKQYVRRAVYSYYRRHFVS